MIIARGEEIRCFTVRPALVALCSGALLLLGALYLLATGYLVLRDDLIGAVAARQARLQETYEDRISTLRAQLDRVTSRQLVDQQQMASKLSELLARQSLLSERHGDFEPQPGTTIEPNGSVSPAKPDRHAEAGSALAALRTAFAAGSDGQPLPAPFAFWSTRTAISTEAAADRADRVFVALNQSLSTIESAQLDRVNSLAENAAQATDAIKTALAEAGLSAAVDFDKADVGGPLVALPDPVAFETKMRALDQALETLDAVKAKVRRLPIANPAPGAPISSMFGIRRDPLLGIPALHAGMDFRVGMGSAVHATAGGVVVKAGLQGGYGRMVEINHGNGFATRYAHLSRTVVTVGERLGAGAVVGFSGSTGRSTGPHLHYEVRQNGQAVDPLRFLKVGRTLAELL